LPLRSNFNKASFFGGAVIPATQNPVYVLEYVGVTHLDPIALHNLNSRSKKLKFIGSVLRDDFGTASDIDFLIEFENDKVPGLIGLSRMERELFAIPNGRKIDLRTPQDLSKYLDMMHWRMLRSNMQHDLIRLRHMA
jgi:predicted nucleotidyltransferase